MRLISRLISLFLTPAFTIAITPTLTPTLAKVLLVSALQMVLCPVFAQAQVRTSAPTATSSSPPNSAAVTSTQKLPTAKTASAKTSSAKTSSVKTASSEVPPVKVKPVRDLALYKAEVALISQSASERQSAIARALQEVIIKLTGDPQSVVNSVIRRSLSSASAFVSEVNEPATAVDSEGNTAIGGVPVYKTTLAVSFDPNAVDALIAGAGLKYWTGARPKPMLWLAIDDGRGPRLVTGRQLNVVKPLAMRGVERGLRFLLPTGNAAEQAAVNAIWQQNAQALHSLSARYGNDTQLLGKVYRDPTQGWTADWLLTQAGVELDRWSVSDVDARRAIASGADPAANALAERVAVRLNTGTAGLYTIDVVDVETQDDFLRLMNYLQTLAIVRKVTVLEASSDHLRVQLDLTMGLNGFRSLVATGDTLRSLSKIESVETNSGLDNGLESVRTGISRFGLKQLRRVRDDRDESDQSVTPSATGDSRENQ